jgi:hypothetical protein
LGVPTFQNLKYYRGNSYWIVLSGWLARLGAERPEVMDICHCVQRSRFRKLLTVRPYINLTAGTKTFIDPFPRVDLVHV